MSVPLSIDQSVVMSRLAELYMSEEMTDLRIVCTDGSLVAHRLVLSSVSDTFNQIVSNNGMSSEANPMVIVMSDHSIKDMKTIVDVIYFGRQSVESNRKKQLIRIADSFGIKLKTNINELFVNNHSLTAGSSNGLPFLSCPKPAHQNSLRL